MAKKKSGRLSLRMDPGIHLRVEKTAKALGLDINGILNLIIRKGLPYYESLADLLSDPPKFLSLFPRWRKLNPGREIEEFYTLYASGGMHRDSYLRFDDGKLYRVNDEGTDFVSMTPEEERELEAELNERIKHASKPKK